MIKNNRKGGITSSIENSKQGGRKPVLGDLDVIGILSSVGIEKELAAVKILHCTHSKSLLTSVSWGIVLSALSIGGALLVVQDLRHCFYVSINTAQCCLNISSVDDLCSHLVDLMAPITGLRVLRDFELYELYYLEVWFQFCKIN